MSVPTISSVREKIVPVLIEFGVRKAVLFGSIAKGTATENSDTSGVLIRG